MAMLRRRAQVAGLIVAAGVACAFAGFVIR
jgi:hypothetical protein